MPRVSETQHSGSEGITRAGWKIVLLASLGGTLEFYDFVVFGVFARDIAEAIFPNTTPIVSLIASFGAFAAGYLARPIGGLVLSHYGDRYGRRTVFLLSLFVMSAATLGMGLVPSYASWGAWASVTMVGLRLVQGFCIGGELPGALTYVVETAPRHAPFVCGLVFACVTLGRGGGLGGEPRRAHLAAPELVPIYGWRIAFVLGGLAGLLSVLMRRAMEESPEFARMKALASRRPFGEVLQTHRGRRAGRDRRAGRHRRLQRPVLRADAGLPVGGAAVQRPRRGHRPDHRRHRPRRGDPRRRAAGRSAVAAADDRRSAPGC